MLLWVTGCGADRGEVSEIARLQGKLIATTLRCRVCGNRAVIQRRKGHVRPAGHIKHLWCTWCRDRTPHTDSGARR